MAADFQLRVRLAEPLREGTDEYMLVETPVTSIGELVRFLERKLPNFSTDNDEIYNFSVNGELILHGEASVPLKSGDEVELLVALAGG